MGEKIALKAIDFYLDSLGSFSGKNKIKLFGGEPLLNIPLIKKIITYIRKKNSSVKIDLTTNGFFLDADLLVWLKRHKVDLTVSIDGDFETQSQNRPGIDKKKYDHIFESLEPFLKETIFSVVIAPNNVDRLVKNILYLYKTGVRKFNLLPAAYVLWDDHKIKMLKSQLDVLSFFVRKNKDIYLKNRDRTGDLFFLNTGLVIDIKGDIFLSDAVMLKEFQKKKDALYVNNVDKVESFDFAKPKEMQSRIKELPELINRSTKSNLIKSNESVDDILGNFIFELNEEEEDRKVVDIKIGYQCNNDCLFCAQGGKREKCSFRKKETIEKELRDTRKTHSSVVFTGGEPTLHPYFLDLVGFAKGLNYESIQIQSNGRMFCYKDFCIKSIQRGASEFSPSLHGHKAELHDFLTSAPGSFKQTVQGIKNLKALGQRVITNSVVTSKNYKHLPELAELLISLGVDQYQFAFVHIVGTAGKNRKWIVPKKSDVMPYIKKGIDLGKKAGRGVMTEAIPYCLMKGYEDCIAERIIPDAKVIERKLTVESFTHYRQNYGKAKGEKCGKCVYNNICEGPWREYPELFGWSEFKPILN
jgi:MoaA/NifB/PqqE/SkfB family radical SAM enzyme